MNDSGDFRKFLEIIFVSQNNPNLWGKKVNFQKFPRISRNSRYRSFITLRITILLILVRVRRIRTRIRFPWFRITSTSIIRIFLTRIIISRCRIITPLSTLVVLSNVFITNSYIQPNFLIFHIIYYIHHLQSGLQISTP